MFIKNSYLSKFVRLKDPGKKEDAQIKSKEYRNPSSTLLKQSKQSYFT